MGSTGQDLRFAFKNLRRTPGLTAVVLVILALGIGGTTAMFSVVDCLLLRDLPYSDFRQLVTLWRDNPPVLVTLFAAMGFVLFVTCVNVTSLLLTRASGRQTEMATRNAIGAPRSRVVRQLLIESVVLSAISGVVGLVVALWGIDALVALFPSHLASLDTVGLSVRLLAIAAVVTVVTGVGSGILPAALTIHRADRLQPMSILRSE
jgi:ABC-type antimicrobial peptide transport system permease subunit